MTRNAWLGIVIAALAFTACKDSATSTATETATKETPPPGTGAPEPGAKESGPSAPAEDPSLPAEAPKPSEQEQLRAVVPVAVDLGRSNHDLAAGLVIRPEHPSAGGRLLVAFLVQPNSRVRTARAWLDDAAGAGAGAGAEKKWVPLGLRQGVSREFMLATLPEGIEHPFFDLARAEPIPATVSKLLVPQWGNPLRATPADPPAVDPERKKQEEELQARYRELQLEEAELRQGLRPEDRRLSSAERMRIERERRTRSGEIRREISEVQRDAQRLGLLLTSRTSPALDPPKRAATIASTAISAMRRDESENENKEPLGLVAMVAETPPANGILPGAFLARATEGGLEVLGLQRLAELCEPRLGTLSGHVRLPRPTTPSLHLRLSLEPSALGVPLLRAGAASPGGLPKDLSSAPVTANGALNSGRTWLEASLSLQDLDIKPGTTTEAAVEIRFTDTEEWVRLAPVTVSWEAHPTNVLRPVLVDSAAITWSAPEPSESSTEAQVPLATTLKRLEVADLHRATQAGSGYHLLVQAGQPPRLRVLDLRREEWVGELALPEGEAIALCAADAERAYVVDLARHTLSSYALPDLQPLQSVRLSDGSLPLQIAAGYNAHDMPLVLSSDRRVELRDPRTLEPSEIVIQYQDSSRDREVGLSAVGWNGNGEHTASQLRSAPDGDHFLLAQSFRDKQRTFEIALQLRKSGADWTLTPANGGVVGREGLLFQNGRPYRSGSSNGLRHHFRNSPRLLLPAVGPGVVAITPSQAQDSYPPSPLHVAYYTSLSEPEPVLSSRAAATAGEALLPQGAAEVELAASLFVLPALAKVVSVGAGEIVIERFAGVDPDRLPPLIGEILPATRGAKWSYAPTDATGKALPLNLVKGPDGAGVVDAGVLSWEVPVNFSLSEVTFEIALGDPPLAQVLPVAIHGAAGSSLRAAGREEVTAVPVSRTLSFPDGIDQVLPSSSGAIAVVISGGCRRATTIDLQTHEVIANYVSSSGIAAFGLGHRHLYVWHLDGDILESRELPGLEPAEIRAMETGSPLVGFVVGSAPGALPPLALFTTERNQTEARSIAPETLETGPAVPVALNVHENSAPPEGMAVHTPPASSDGGTIFFANRVLVRNGSGEFEAVEMPTSHVRGVPTHFNLDGSSLFLGDTATDLATRRSWSTKLGSIHVASNSKSLLWPDLNQATILAVTKYQPDNSNSRSQNYRIHFLDADTQELRYELDQLFEWDQTDLPLFAGKLANSRLLFYSRSGTLLTISADGMRLIARKLPLDLPK